MRNDWGCSKLISSTPVHGRLQNFLRCPHAQCILMPLTGSYLDGTCMAAFSTPCSLNATTQRNNCCTDIPRIKDFLEVEKSFFDIHTSSRFWEDFTKHREFMWGVNANFGYYSIQGTFSTPNSSIFIMGASDSPDDMPMPPASLVVGAALHIVLEEHPMKPIQILYKLDSFNQGVMQSSKCGMKDMMNASRPIIFYFDSPTAKWMSIPGSHMNPAGGAGNIKFVTLIVPPEVMIRNGLSLFLVPIMGVPVQDVETESYTLPSIGVLRKGGVDEARAAMKVEAMNIYSTECIFPVKLNSSEYRAAARQGIFLHGSPTLISLDEIPQEAVSIKMHVADAEASISSASRRLLQQQQLSNASILVPNFYNRTSGQWEVLVNCTYNHSMSSFACVVQPSFMQQVALQLIAGLFLTPPAANASAQNQTTIQQEAALQTTPVPPEAAIRTTPVPEKDSRGFGMTAIVGVSGAALVVVLFLVFIWRRRHRDRRYQLMQGRRDNETPQDQAQQCVHDDPTLHLDVGRFFIPFANAATVPARIGLLHTLH